MTHTGVNVCCQHLSTELQAGDKAHKSARSGALEVVVHFFFVEQF
jgi:hypothetical protein